MSHKCTTGNRTVIVLGRSSPNCCKCGCNNSKGGIQLPSGGEDGDVLVKNGDGLIWVPAIDIATGTSTIYIPITEDGQTIFLSVIPVNKAVTNLLIDGIAQVKDTDYEINGQNIIWKSTDFQLVTTMLLTLKVT